MHVQCGCEGRVAAWRSEFHGWQRWWRLRRRRRRRRQRWRGRRRRRRRRQRRRRRRQRRPRRRQRRRRRQVAVRSQCPAGCNAGCPCGAVAVPGLGSLTPVPLWSRRCGFLVREASIDPTPNASPDSPSTPNPQCDHESNPTQHTSLSSPRHHPAPRCGHISIPTQPTPIPVAPLLPSRFLQNVS